MTSPDNGPVAVAPDTRRAPGLYPIDIAFSDYDRTRPLVDGRVKAEGLKLNPTVAWVGDFCVRPVYEEFDAAEMSMSLYAAARDRGEPCIAIPIFLLRDAALAYVYVRADSGITQPSDLIGKRIGVQGYRNTINLWLRGFFKEHYGFAPEQAVWVATRPADNGYVIPKGITVELRPGKTPEEKLRDGEVDAIFCPRVPQVFIDGEKWIRRLFLDAQGELRQFVKRTNILPIGHTVVLKKSLVEREPWIAKSLYDAFVAAQRCADEVCQIEKMLSLFDSMLLIEQHRAAYGDNPYQHGLTPANRNNLDTFLRYAHEQSNTSRQLSVDELFVPGLGL
jgi:4,5-dihydroxyphthalate decarboxylase